MTSTTLWLKRKNATYHGCDRGYWTSKPQALRSRLTTELAVPGIRDWTLKALGFEISSLAVIKNFWFLTTWR
jgi:hypothetical protein